MRCEGVDLAALASTHGTPLYVYSTQTIRDHYRRLDAALEGLDHLICYAVKANSNLAVLDLLVHERSGFDIVSAGELFRVLKAGGRPECCTFAGVGKTREEIEYALRQGILSFNVESEAELEMINAVAHDLNRRAPIALRVNPDVEAGGHKYISTGKSENKFGVGLDRALEVYRAASQMEHVRVRGVQMHIGSQITEPGPFAKAVAKVAPVAAELKKEYGIEFFSIGGGLGIVYKSSLESGQETWWRQDAGEPAPSLTVEQYAAAVVPALKPLGLRILLEPGRFMVGNAGVLLSTVQYLKTSDGGKRFVIVDAGMNDLIRPALYQGYHEVVPVREPAPNDPRETADVVGPVCESGDFFAQARELPPLRQGEVIALMSAGAYGFTMASNYNSRPLAAEVLVNGERAAVVRERQGLNDLMPAGGALWRMRPSWARPAAVRLTRARFRLHNATVRTLPHPMKPALRPPCRSVDAPPSLRWPTRRRRQIPPTRKCASTPTCPPSRQRRDAAPRRPAGPPREYVCSPAPPRCSCGKSTRPCPMTSSGPSFVRASRTRFQQIEAQQGNDPNALYTWLVFEDGYRARGAQDHQDYVSDINSVRDKYHLHLVPVLNGNDVVNYLNNGQDRGRMKVVDFEYFGHSNRCCFMFDYSNNIDSASKFYLHEDQLAGAAPQRFRAQRLCQKLGLPHRREHEQEVLRRHRHAHDRRHRPHGLFQPRRGAQRRDPRAQFARTASGCSRIRSRIGERLGAFAPPAFSSLSARRHELRAA